MRRPHLKVARKAKGWSQGEFAELAGVSRTIVSDWEQGRCAPSICRLELLSSLLDVSIEHLVTGKPDDSSRKILSGIPFKWEKLQQESSTGTDRAKVFGGWILRDYDYIDGGISMVFIPDPNHEWEVV